MISPHEGEEPLHLVLTLIPAVLAVLIFGYIAVRMAREYGALRAERRARPDPQGFKAHAAVQDAVDDLYRKRRAIRGVFHEAKVYAYRDYEETLELLDVLLMRAVASAHEQLASSGEEAALEAVASERARVIALLDEAKGSEEAISRERMRELLEVPA